MIDACFELKESQCESDNAVRSWDNSFHHYAMTWFQSYCNESHQEAVCVIKKLHLRL